MVECPTFEYRQVSKVML